MAIHQAIRNIPRCNCNCCPQIS